jgi:hypothetical protein
MHSRSKEFEGATTFELTDTIVRDETFILGGDAEGIIRQLLTCNPTKPSAVFLPEVEECQIILVTVVFSKFSKHFSIQFLT